MAKVEVSFTLILCFLSFALLASSPEALAAPLKNAAKKVDGDGFETLGKKAGLVRHLCNETGHYNLCVAAVEADPRSNLKSHRKGILQIVMGKTISNATAILEYIDRLLADNTTKMENATRDSLKGCSSGYHDSIYELENAISLLELKNVSQYFDLRTVLSGMQFFKEASRNMRESSANRRWESMGPLFLTLTPPNSFLSIASEINEERQSATKRKRYRDSGSPCRIPLESCIVFADEGLKPIPTIAAAAPFPVAGLIWARLLASEQMKEKENPLAPSQSSNR
ncbi:hypothetical protein RHSIM_Rhsim02G0010300 [Rhododendron simsii]|uniref:Pectinesterase inhibitor domain-containing protein n=1 Tax=Rhododendron simsii TaxID=118357 RepID=A0A834LY60_RHOSS|nr:hypothetical protein RHSIM_Rhsim02G0010300 [Rhododendron simsii]